MQFPRSNERGSIEAKSLRPSTESGLISFHVRMNVAELKPVQPVESLLFLKVSTFE